MKPFVQISDSELEIMKIIWAHEGTALYADIMKELLAESKSWKKNTVLTFLSRLVEKGLLEVQKIGRRNEYRAVVSEQEYQAAQTKTLLDKLYRGNAKNLVSALVQQEYLTSEDFEELQRFWNGGDGNG